ncbi:MULTISPECIES: DUF2953 domain-containing protein [unclassified Dehalobacter]|uniref:DUF2953 domain-containing protein n=1 Tax=unclassified Dehalobacter TaxID=2635733 RepID=UPI00037DAA2D|nr:MULTISPECIES: DUF2953 domain-containing protein [unclassified Dehalobacter]RJE46946.1 hypothetical protein A7K50_05460 [Dehalobacter sp. MCB1]TCX50870.1 hypothetical protein C1I38_11715 [Dehalobacter sp. 12DCB1]TCX51582.1 hypothetical protein C1I36_04415 [Dehalobacter sp. 14DCB1]
MTILALLIACLIWVLVLALFKINLVIDYTFKNFSSVLKIHYQAALFRSNLEINIPAEMVSGGFLYFLLNSIENIQQNDCLHRKSNKNTDPTRKRYRLIKHFLREAVRHYGYSTASIRRLQQGLSNIIRAFYRKIKVHCLQADLELGCRDAAETGYLTGACWTTFGFITARLHRHISLKQEDFTYRVTPNFTEKIFLFKLCCILNLKSSHIIFTGYKFLLMILKNRRTRNYG